MIEILKFIEELEKIRNATFKRTIIDETIEKYEKIMKEFEEAENDN